MKILCPNCKESSILTPELVVCRQCGREFKSPSSPIFDFVSSAESAEERSYYDSTYIAEQRECNRKQSVDSVQPQWYLPQLPERRIVLAQLGDLSGKTVLLLGNGESVKELLFLKMGPAHIVYSDLSSHALENIYQRFDLEQYRKRLTFAAIDAQDIPFAEGTFDVIYGYAMVHHLPHLERFFKSTINALKPGGYTVFMDDAYAPIWHYSKRTWLKPLMRFSHKKTGISPEDLRFTMTGGFKEDDLAAKVRLAGGEPWFIRTSFITYLVYRGSAKVLPHRIAKMLRNQKLSRAVRRFDKWLCKLPVLKQNQIRLIWGFTKP